MIKVLITGRPGIGKTTVVKRVMEMCLKFGIKVGGMITYEMREEGRRVGFKVVDVLTRKEGILAKIGISGKFRIGKYTVNLRDLENVGVRAIREALSKADIVIIDEIGPMELFSEEFRKVVEEAFNSRKPVIATIHIKADRYPLCRRIKRFPNVKMYVINYSNRNFLPKMIFRELMNYLKQTKSQF